MRVGVSTGLGAATANVLCGALIILGLDKVASLVAFNATNPLSPILIVGLLAPIIGQSAPSLGGVAALLFGMFAAATTWWVCLSGGIALLRSRLSPGILVIVNQVAGAILTVYGVAALARSAGM